MRRFLFLITLLALSGPVYAGDIRVTSTFDKRAAHVNEEIKLKILVTGASGNVQAPRLPGFNGFDTFYTGRASHITFVNGQSSSSVEFNYVLVARAAGSYTLPPIELSVEGRVFRTDQVKIEVSPTSGSFAGRGSTPGQGQFTQPLATTMPQSQGPVPSGGPDPYVQPPPVTARPDDDNIFMHAWIDKTEVYPGEQVLLTYSLYTRYDTRYEGFEEEPELSGFWKEEFPMERNIQKETVRYNGKRYVKADTRKIALFATAHADYTIKPGVIKVSVRQEPQQTSIFDDFFSDSFFSGGSFFARRENRLLNPPVIALKVKPFPKRGKPESFQGDVGNYTMTASVDKKQIKQNEPVTLTLVLEGDGNIETLNKPKIPELPKFKVYDADTSSQLFKSGTVIGGRKTFEIVFIPIEAGNLTIPKLQFSFFSPRTESYQTLETPEFKLEVEKSEKQFELPRALSQRDLFKKGIEVEGRDVRFIWEKLPDEKLKQSLGYVYYGLIGLNALLTFLLIGGIWMGRMETIFEKDTAFKRRHFARSHAESGIKKLKAMARTEEGKNPQAYFDEVDRVLTKYISDKFDLSALGGTRVEIEGMLRQKLGAEDALYGRIVKLYQICDESRFGGGKATAASMGEALQVVRDTVARVEKIKR